MTTYFPPKFVCDEELRNNYLEIEQRMLPIIKVKAVKLRHLSNFDFDDVVQEGRIALLKAMTKYDSNRGSLENFVGVVLDNAYNSLLLEHTTRSRMPRVVYKIDDIWKQISLPPISLDTLIGLDPVDFSKTPEEKVEHDQLEKLANKARIKMFDVLKGRELDVFVCKINPPIEFLIMVKNMGGDHKDPTNLHIAKYLGIKKNAVDWSLFKIREKFTKLCRQKEFSDLLGDVVLRKGWPMIHVSCRNEYDLEFVMKITSKRRLDLGLKKHVLICFKRNLNANKNMRIIKNFSWGCIMFLRYNDKCCTLVIEGRLNPDKGFVYGDKGARERLPVNWYKQLVKNLKAGGKKNED